MQNHPSSSQEDLDSSIEISLVVGAPAFCTLLLLLWAVEWAISGWSPELSSSHMIHQGWLEFVKLIQMTLALVFAALICTGSFLLTVALGNRIRKLWWQLRHR